MKRIVPPVPWSFIWRATACAARNAPVVLTLRVRDHSAGVMSRACVQPTTPAKHRRWSMEPRVLDTVSTARSSSVADVTSTWTGSMRAWGKSFFKDWISGLACDASRSKRARPVRPCSSNARALTKARVPVPPVTVSIQCQHVELVQWR